MKAGPVDAPLNRSAAAQAPALQPAHGPHPGHAHGHDHAHDHGPAHEHSHAHPAPRPLVAKVASTSVSLLMSSAMLRLAGAVGLTALLWAAVAWALSGTP